MTSNKPGPTADQYETALRRLPPVTGTQLRILRIHYHAPERTISATALAEALGHAHYASANSQYGRLGRMVGELLDYNPMKERLGTLVTFDKRDGEWHWILRPQVAAALERLGWLQEAAPEAGRERAPDQTTEASFIEHLLGQADVSILNRLPEEVPERLFFEGGAVRVTVNRYERDPNARAECLRIRGSACSVCRVDLASVYGPIASDLVHVHHVTPISSVDRGYKVDPRTDLVPVCPNCHAALHRRDPPLSPDELRDLMERASAG